MTLSDNYLLACYETIAVLNEEHGVYLVQHKLSKNIYVKKYLTVYNLSVYQYLKSHHIKGTPEILEIVEDNEKLIVIEEYISGQTLRSVLDNGSLFSEKQAVEIISQLCGILREFHNASPAFIHRDIKPSNIIQTSDGSIRLLDMNAAKLCNTPSSETTAMIGTVGYAAPEQYGFGEVDLEADIYSLGVLLNELLTGAPLKEKTASGHLGIIVQKCTRLDPKARYHSIDELMADLVPEQTPASVEAERKKSKYTLPGFRSGNLTNMIIALQGYGLALFLFLTLDIKSAASKPILWTNRVFFALCTLVVIAFSCNYLNIWHLLRIDRIRKPVLKILAVFLSEAAVVLVLVFVTVIIESGM